MKVRVFLILFFINLQHIKPNPFKTFFQKISPSIRLTFPGLFFQFNKNALKNIPVPPKLPKKLLQNNTYQKTNIKYIENSPIDYINKKIEEFKLENKATKLIRYHCTELLSEYIYNEVLPNNSFDNTTLIFNIITTPIYYDNLSIKEILLQNLKRTEYKIKLLSLYNEHNKLLIHKFRREEKASFLNLYENVIHHRNKAFLKYWQNRRAINNLLLEILKNKTLGDKNIVIEKIFTYLLPKIENNETQLGEALLNSSGKPNLPLFPWALHDFLIDAKNPLQSYEEIQQKYQREEYLFPPREYFQELQQLLSGTKNSAEKLKHPSIRTILPFINEITQSENKTKKI